MRLEKGGKNAAIRGDKVKRLKHSFEPRPITDIRFARIKKRLKTKIQRAMDEFNDRLTEGKSLALIGKIIERAKIIREKVKEKLEKQEIKNKESEVKNRITPVVLTVFEGGKK